MEQETEDRIKAKIAISLQRLLSNIKEKKTEEFDNDQPENSYGRIASYALMRKATVSDTFNGKTIPNAKTLILIVEAMGYTLTEFATEYDSISNSDVKEC